ncbi:MAG: glutamate-5-semialdehyde dehydrogenase [Planctomycetes bacterium]|nr:glutamate-5-semialdehyde dehydrogenase [Planctomycetota bacterium]
MTIADTARGAKEAARRLAAVPSATKDAALEAAAREIEARREEILAANARDLVRADAEVAAGRMTRALRRRLALDERKMQGVVDGIRDVVRLEDPTGCVEYEMELDEGLVLRRVRCPIGVLAVIFEARPEVVPQIAALALKSGNAAILKGGSEASESNRTFHAAIVDAFARVPEIPAGALQLVETREEVRELLTFDAWIDLVIPRGSKALVRSIQEATRIPVLGHTDGICHVYLAASADPEKAMKIVLDAKLDYPAACNAMETLLVDEACAARILPPIARALADAGVRVRGCPRARAIVPSMSPASDADWDAEYLDLILSVRVVDGLEGAIEHIHRHGSAHTEAIVTEDPAEGEAFLARVDASGVYCNASTRFADGYRYGLGAEVGISTNKTHARGPVGLEGLTIYKYELRGAGHAAGDFGPGKRRFLHRRIR